ncbi:MAG: tetratricopeptide repeat protein [Alistipes sp.]|nr:tetratricopeptide repeat protein [Alistipes sp.]
MKRYIILILSLLYISYSYAQEAEQAVESAEQAASTVEQSVAQPMAATPTQMWEQANAAYNSGDYSSALKLYEAIQTEGLHSAALYYNMANAYFKMDELAESILYYNRALRLAPADEDIRHNLEYAESMTKDSIEKIPEFILTTWVRAVRGAFSSTAWSVLSLVLLATSLAMMLVYLLAQRLSLRKVGFYVMMVAGVLFILTTIFAWGEGRMDVEHREAVVMNSAVSIKSSPDRAATELFVLHEGTKLVIGATIDGWAEVRIADGRKGWIEESRIERI